MPIEIIHLDATITVPYEELSCPQASPREDIRAASMEATRYLQCDWADRLVLARDLLGYTQRSGEMVIHHRPHVYPHHSALSAEVAAVSPAGAPAPAGGAMAWAKARLRVTYRPPAFGSAGDDPARALVSESIEPAAEFLTVPAEDLYWDAAQEEPLGDDYELPKLVRMAEWVYTRHRMPYIPAGTWSLIGRVNASAVTSARLNASFAAETLLYQPPQLYRRTTSDGTDGWDITYRFTYRPDGWNKFYRPGETDPQPIYDAAGTVFKPYAAADFSAVVG